MKRITRNSVLVILLTFVLFAVILQAFDNNIVYADNNAYTTAKSMVVYEGKYNKVLYEKNCHDRLAMASTTKIATAIVAIENCKDLDAKFVVSDNAVGIEGTSIYLKEGE